LSAVEAQRKAGQQVRNPDALCSAARVACHQITRWK
jgi:hypothetical protein